MNDINFPGFGDADEPDDGALYERWRESVGIVEAVGNETADEILGNILSGHERAAAGLLRKAYATAWAKAQSEMRNARSVAGKLRKGIAPNGFDD